MPPLALSDSVFDIMPVRVDCPIHACSEEEFYQIDQKVRGIAFDIHNQLGRFFDEQIYQTELANRCRLVGLNAATEVKISVTHGSFEKEYFLDLLIENKVIVKLKTAAQITSVHRAQTLNYLLLCNLNHGSLLNFRQARVKHEFVSSRQSPESRKHFVIQADSSRCTTVQEKHWVVWLHELISDWGTGLDTQLYREAIIHLLGGAAQVIRPIPVLSSGKVIGMQNMHMLNDTQAFAVTAIGKDQQHMEKHFCKALSSSNLEGMAWINFNRQIIEIRFLKTSRSRPPDTQASARTSLS